MADVELVIRVPEEVYKKAKETHDVMCDSVWLGIKYGTLLPKGHGRLKDIDWIDDNCENHYSDTDGSWCYKWKDIDDKAPTIINADK